MAGFLNRVGSAGPPIDRSMVGEVLTSRVTSSLPPSSKRAKSSTPNSSQPGSTGQADLTEADLGDVPPSSMIDASSPPRDCSSTAAGVEAPAPPSFRVEDQLGGPTSGAPPLSMLQDVSLARERLSAFVTGVEVQEIVSRGPEGMINATVEGFALVCFIPLLRISLSFHVPAYFMVFLVLLSPNAYRWLLPCLACSIIPWSSLMRSTAWLGRDRHEGLLRMPRSLHGRHERMPRSN